MNAKTIMGLLLLWLLPLAMKAQQLTIIGEPRINVSDLAARTSPRNDGNKNPCALVKVMIPRLDNVKFSGMVVGEVRREASVYWVYMAEDSKKLTITHSDFQPLEVKFTKPLKGLTTYEVVVNVPEQKNAGKAYFTVTVPETNDFTVEIDGKVYPAKQGRVRENLPIGRHSYTVRADRFLPSTGDVNLEGEPVECEIHLKSITGLCQIRTDDFATILIDGTAVTQRNVELQVGTHEIVASYGSYEYRQKVNVKSEGVSFDMRLGSKVHLTGPAGATATISPIGNATGQKGEYTLPVRLDGMLGSYNISLSKSRYKSKYMTMTVDMRKDISKGYSMKHTVDSYFFMNWQASLTAPVGLMFGKVQRAGWYLAAQVSPYQLKGWGGSVERISRRHINTDLTQVSDYANLKECGINNWNATGGMVFRLTSWCFPFIGGGFGWYQRVYENSHPSMLVLTDGNSKNYYSDMFFSRFPAYKGACAEAGLMLRFGGLTVSGKYNMLFGKQKFSDVSIGIGFDVNLSND